MLAKIRKKNFKKVIENKSKNAGEHLVMNVIVIKQESLGKLNIWLLIDDQYFKMEWSIFTIRKSLLL
jgi:hypothetical protein